MITTHALSTNSERKSLNIEDSCFVDKISINQKTNIFEYQHRQRDQTIFENLSNF